MTHIKYDYCCYFDKLGQPCEKQTINKFNGLCSRHLHFFDHNWDEQESLYCSQTIRKLLNDVAKVKGIEKKAKIAITIFDCLVKHKKFLYNYKKFSKVVNNKLLEFKNDNMVNKLIDIQYYIKKLDINDQSNILLPSNKDNILDNDNISDNQLNRLEISI